MLVKFVKYEGAGNDFILIDDREGAFRPDAGHIAALCDRHFGIGGDGVVLMYPSDVADVKMRMFNLDGTEGKMCGNAARCIAKYLIDNGLQVSQLEDEDVWKKAAMEKVWPEMADFVGGKETINAYLKASSLGQLQK